MWPAAERIVHTRVPSDSPRSISTDSSRSASSAESEVDDDEKSVVIVVSSRGSSIDSSGSSASSSNVSAYDAGFPSDFTVPLSPSSSAPPAHQLSAPTRHPYASLPSSPDPSLDDDTLPTCRLCFEGDSDGELIVPCHCSGTSQWVHRHCLDGWRAVSVGVAAFHQCTTCNFHYVYERPLIDPSTWHTVKCRLLVVRDVLGILLLLQAWLIALAALIGGFDSAAGHGLATRFSALHPYAVFYLSSVVLSLALFGLFGFLTRLAGNGNDCNCDGCPANVGGDAAGCAGLFVCLIVVFAVVGLIYGIVAGSVLVESIVERHVRKGWYWPEVEKYRVVDWKNKLEELRQIQEPMARVSICGDDDL